MTYLTEVTYALNNRLREHKRQVDLQTIEVKDQEDLTLSLAYHTEGAE